MAEATKHDEQFQILTEAERSSRSLRVLKHGDTFAVFDPHGDLAPGAANEHGLYSSGTRFLSRVELLLANRRPLLLSSTISEDNTVFAADLTNPDVLCDGRVSVARGQLHVFRSRVLWDATCVERVRIANYALHAIETTISLGFDADFADIFEVRGTRRAQRGQRLPDVTHPDLVLRYRGLDGRDRRTRIRSAVVPDQVEGGVLLFRLSLDPHASAEIEVSVSCELDADAPAIVRYDDVLTRVRRRAGEGTHGDCAIDSSRETFNRWVRRSSSDLTMMITDTPDGPYPYAGIPWFSTPFGRDGIITALELLWARPDIARGVLTFLAETQATRTVDAQDAQPGKILHEMRMGEMAALNEIPFGRYYGSADATPLFVVLAYAYFQRTGDLAFVDRLWPHILAALNWIETFGDLDGDGFVEYARRSGSGLLHQGWKDSNDSVFHADGSLAEPPIALCEIQGYVYCAWTGASRLALLRGDGAAARWYEQAERLRTQFDQAFWLEDLGTYALALDARKRPCRVRTSNPGHCLFTGIASAERARVVAQTLMADTSFAGWGVRTAASDAARYNPMSYHNGSIWPHDNALIASGLARYGLTTEASRIMGAMFDLSQNVDMNRLPELICGFHRRGGEAPTLYPVACAPQAWAAGAVYMLLEACLGLRIDAVERRVSFSHAVLPDTIDWLRISNLSIADARVDLLLTRYAQDVGVTVMRREGELEVVTVK